MGIDPRARTDEYTRVNLWVAAEDASWTIREAAWGLEERVLWRGSDGAHRAIERAQRRLEPLQRLIDTRIAWPLADAWRQRSTAARAGIATAAVAGAMAAGTAGAMTEGGGADSAPASAAPIAAAPDVQSADAQALAGAAPQFEVGHAKVPVNPAPPSAPPAKVAWRFAGAFVQYEVGKPGPETAKVFAETAIPALAKSLEQAPPRLPASGPVPEARVLNVVLADATDKRITASVSLVRLKAISEIRLTLQRDGEGWRVAEVLG